MGIFLISLAADQIELGFTDLDEVGSRMLNEAVHVRGVVKEAREFSAGVRLLIEQDGFSIAVVYFGEAPASKGMCADVTGEVKTSDGSVEIEAIRLRLFIC